MDVAGLDLNLLVPLRALLEMRHVTRAAERIHLSQPAMSATLSRLRRHFDDELLVRVGGGYELTPLARRLLPLVTEAVRSAENAFRARSGFNPVESDRRFVVIASHYAAAVVGPPLRAQLELRAPQVSIEFHAMPRHLLAERDVLESDVIIGPIDYGFPGAREILFEDDFVCLLADENPAAAETAMTVELLAHLPHAAASFASNLPTRADLLLEELGVSRRVLVVADDWLTLPWLIRATDLVALIPRRVAAWMVENAGFQSREVPGPDRGRFSEAVFWHPSRDTDPGLLWLRQQLQEVGSSIGSRRAQNSATDATAPAHPAAE